VAFGYHGKILHIDLASGTFKLEEPPDEFYRKYLGGSAVGAYYALKYTPSKVDPLSPENTITRAAGVVTGAPIPGQSRITATAKSAYYEKAGWDIKTTHPTSAKLSDLGLEWVANYLQVI